MRKDLIEKAEAAARAEAEGAALPGLRPDEPQAKRVGSSGLPAVCYAQERDKPERAKPWMVGGGQGRRYVARVASPAEGAAVAQVYEAAGEKLRDADPKAMRETVKRMARQLTEGQLPLPLGDGLDGWQDKAQGDE